MRGVRELWEPDEFSCTSLPCSVETSSRPFVLIAWKSTEVLSPPHHFPLFSPYPRGSLLVQDIFKSCL